MSRPPKYGPIVEKLEDDVVYSPALIYRHAADLGIASPEIRSKIRHTFARFAKNNGFPVDGDGLVRIPGQPITIGWLGRRWKEHYLNTS